MSPLVFKRLSDEQLGRRLASGEAAAFDELYRRYAHRLAAYAAQLLGDGPAGDDVAQTALLKAYSAIRAGRGPDRVKPWLYRVTHNVALDVVKHRRELPAAQLPETPAPGGSADGGALVAALAALPDRQRRVYVLRELHGLRIDETAAELGLSAAQVEQALFAARNRMAEHLVFGDRLDCVAVRRLASGPLALDERRALRTHLRSCPACRAAVPARGLGSFPFSPLDWLRALTGFGAPAAAKVAAAVAGAGAVAGVPMTVERSNPPHRLPSATVATTKTATKHVVRRTASPVRNVALVVSKPVVATPAARPRADERRTEPAEPERRHDDTKTVETETAPPPEAAPTTTETTLPDPSPVESVDTSEGHDGGEDGGDSSHDGGDGHSSGSDDGLLP